MIIVGSVVAALLVIVAIALFFVLGELRSQADDAAYKDCMARQGFAADEVPPPVSSDDELEEYLGLAVDAAEFCSR
jgi:hypothetical protein